MPANDDFDVKQLVDQSGEKLNVDDLKKKGFERINVLDKNTFNNLISQAVERIISTRTSLLSDREREKIFAASKNEMKMLMSEHQQLQKQSQLQERDKTSLIEEVQNLQKQVQLARKIQAEEGQSRYEEGMDSQRPLIEELKRQIEVLEAENGKLKEESASKPAGPSPEMMEQLQQMTQNLQSNMDAKMAAMEQAMAQQASNPDVLAQVQKLADNVGQKMESIEQSVAARQEEMDMLRADLRERLEAKAKDDDRVGGNMESLMQKMTDSLSKKIQSIKSGEEGGDYRPGTATLEELFNTELESNLENIDSESVETEKVDSTLDKLKALRGNKK